MHTYIKVDLLQEKKELIESVPAEAQTLNLLE